MDRKEIENALEVVATAARETGLDQPGGINGIEFFGRRIPSGAVKFFLPGSRRIGRAKLIDLCAARESVNPVTSSD